MGEIFVVVEHRKGEVREITYQMLWKANDLCQKLSQHPDGRPDRCKERALSQRRGGKGGQGHCRRGGVQELQRRSLQGNPFQTDSGTQPLLTLMVAHTPWGMDFAPSLSVKLGYPVATDCVDVLVDNGKPKVVRQIYSGKALLQGGLPGSPGVTWSPSGAGPFRRRRWGTTREKSSGRRCLRICSRNEEASLLALKTRAQGAVDITQAELLVSIGRGVGEADKMPIVKELADKMKGVLSCSRPVVDKNWLPKFHQVGTSGKSVKPKVYLAFGISGAFQHVAGITGAGTCHRRQQGQEGADFPSRGLRRGGRSLQDCGRPQSETGVGIFDWRLAI